MLNKITLTCFRQHLDRTFEFASGLNAVRGENEAGKTTVLEAYTYFCFGVRSLRQPIDQIVTYHHPESKLRVDVELTHLGVTYTGYRSPKGAEVSFGKEKVTGQTEVTKFFENLFGADAKLAGKLMFASQKALAESLKAGPTEAGQMIEDLANFDLLERVVEAIQAKRPCGVTTGVEGRITTLQAQLVEQPAEDLAPLKLDIIEAEGRVAAGEKQIRTLRENRDNLLVDLAREILADEKRLAASVESATRDIGLIDAALAAPIVVTPTESDLATARAEVESEKQYSKAAGLHADLVKAKVEALWDKDVAALEAEVVEAKEKFEQHGRSRAAAVAEVSRLERALADTRRDFSVSIAQLEGRLIKETTCALCQKDLSDVPEVVQINSDIGRQLEAVRAELGLREKEIGARLAEQEHIRDQTQAELDTAEAYLGDLSDVQSANAKVEQLYARAADFIAVDRSTVPGTWTWAGPQIGGDRPDVAGRLARLEKQQREALQDATRREEQQAQRDRLEARLEADTAARQALQVRDAQETLEEAAELDKQLQAANLELDPLKTTLQQLQSTLSTKVALQEQHTRMLEQTRAQLTVAEADLANMQRYNALIKKVKSARPVITNKLWNIVLAGVSKHFTEVRGEPSAITRADNMFKCNGQPVAGLSGSAEDMLGLSLRIALTKTFLPGADFLQLDEPGAACSDQRETKMLGMLSTLNFGQIIMISHNDLVDSFADRIITV